MIQIPFYRIDEQQPQHQEAIIWLWRRSAFDLTSFDPREVTVEYTWVNHETGNQTTYQQDDPEGSDIPAGYSLEILLDHQYAEPYDLWCPLDVYASLLENAL